MKPIAILGNGIMAKGMIKNLQRNGYPLRLYNRTPSKIEATDRDVICPSPALAVSSASVVFSCVTDDVASKEIWFGEHGHGAVFGLKPNTTVIECSTLSIEFINEWKNKMQNIGSKPIDAPMTGSKIGAETGNLVLFLGGDEKDIKQICTILESISKKYYHLGEVGSGTKFKLMFNLFNATCLVALAEAFYVSDSFDLDLNQVLTIFKEDGGWIAKIAQVMGDSMLFGVHEHQDIFIRLALMNKDVSYALKEVNVPLGNQVHEIFQACNSWDDLNMSAVSEFYFGRNR